MSMHLNSENPLVSIILATYNTGDSASQTLESIISQSYKNIEIIVIDGLSQDQTLAVTQKYKQHIAHIVSERDNGIYDAWNKGITLSKGDWITFLGAGDSYVTDGLLSYIEFLKNHSEPLDFVSSYVEIVTPSGKLLYQLGSPWKWPTFRKYMTTAHPGAFHSRHLFEKYGRFDSSYKIAGDYELILRAGKNLSAGFFPKVTVQMVDGGVSNSYGILFENYRLKRQTGKVQLWYAFPELCLNFIKRTIRFTFNRLGLYIMIRK